MPRDAADVVRRIRELVTNERVVFTLHAHEEMVGENFSADDTLHALASGELLENYPDHKRGPCCLINGTALDGRPLHAVCATALPNLVIITVYEPCAPKWITPRERRR